MAGLLGPLEPAPPLFADSGAFSAHTLGAAITIGEYATWLEKWAALFPLYASLDVLDDWRASARNQKALERRGLTPIPVFHGGEPWKVLEAMIERYEYVALGGMAAGSVSRGAKLIGWLDRCFTLAEGCRGGWLTGGRGGSMVGSSGSMGWLRVISAWRAHRSAHGRSSAWRRGA